MNFLKRYGPAFIGGLGVAALALFLFAERPPRTVQSTLVPELGGSHMPTDVWHGDKVAFRCPSCPPNSEFKIVKIEFLRSKILDELSGVPGSEDAQHLVEEMPPRPSLGVPPSPFASWVVPTDYVDQGTALTTTPVDAMFESFYTTQIYAVTWSLRSSGAVQAYDPHIYAHGGKRR